MKHLFTTLTLTAFAFALPTSSFAAEEKKEATPSATKKLEDRTKDAAKDAIKAVTMYTRVDSIDAAGKSFTTKRKDGVEVKHVVTATTEIKNGEAAAKFEDIKVGDQVSGLQTKKSETEYEVVKITKFGAAAEKTGKKDEAAKTEEKK